MMDAIGYAEWLARGRAHQQEGRAVDAMLCFRRAVHADPRAADARFHLGEVLWQLGRVKDAIGTWRDAARVAPNNLSVLLALAESLLATGDAAGAREAASRALGVSPVSAHAIVLEAIARLALGETGGGDPPANGIADVLQREPRLLSIPTVAGPLALALDAAPAAAGRAALLAHLVRLPETLGKAPPLLLALAIEHAAAEAGVDANGPHAALFAQAVARGYAPDDHDALRRIALVAMSLHAGVATELRAHYARLCAHVHASPVPLPWPRRCAGDRLRVVVILGAAVDDVVRAAATALAALPRNAYEVTFALVGVGLMPQSLIATEDARALPVIELPSVPDAGAARRVAALVPDVLVDLAGLTAATGQLLAQHPARTTLTLGDLAAPNVDPLVDRTLATVGELIESLRQERANGVPSPPTAPEPGTMAALWEEAVRTHQRGDRALARDQYARVLELQPGFALAHYLRGVLSREEGDSAAARDDFLAALAVAPGHVDARLAAARLALEAGQPDVAALLCAEGIDAAPQKGGLLRAWGLAELGRHDGVEAALLFEHALALEPTDGDTHYNHGVALQMQHAYADAARAYQRALAFKPDLIAADFNLGVIFQEQGNTEAAIAAYRNVLDHDAKHVAAYKNLGEVLVAAGRLDAWFVNFGRFEANCPDALPLAVQALEVLQHRGDFENLERYLDGLRLERFRAGDQLELCDSLEQLLYLLLFFDVDASVAFRFAQTYDQTTRRVHGIPLPPVPARRPGPLRIGYLSADLRNHVMGKMMWQAVQYHDRSRFALHFYALSPQHDDWTARFEAIADRFEVVANLSEREAAQRILEDDLDLLVDLSTHTKGAKPGILALKPARVQLTHVASAGTVGLSAIDFKLTDRLADVAENQAHQLETLLAMDGCVYPYRHVAPAATHPFRRDTLGIAADAVLIGAFVSPLKLSRRCLGLWREVLERIPRARLAFSPANPAFRDSYVRLAAATGIAPDRLLFLPQGRDDAENQARYELIDLVLDTMPFGGVNGTLEALDMGVPVVTLVGKRHGERTSFSILANLGVMHTVAQGGREYVDIAARLANDSAFMREVRAAIQAGLAHSALVDMRAHTQRLEDAYLRALALRAPAALEAAGIATAEVQT